MKYLILTLISFLASLIGEMAGFGIGTISTPLLLFLFPFKTVVPLAAIISTIVSGVIAIRTKTKGVYSFLLPLVIGTLFGVPIGMYFLDIINVQVLSLLITLFLIGYALYGFFVKEKVSLPHNNLIGGVLGFITGIFSSLFNVSGPFIGAYITQKKSFKPNTYKDTIASYVFFCHFLTIIGHFLEGRITNTVLELLVYSLPGILLGLFVGNKIFNQLNFQTIKKIAYFFILIAGIALLF